ncbi:cytochrome b/b6 domain-containing protein [bacterium]|nr:cytochrome b/b6 domain-containing protein [bacterium]
MSAREDEYADRLVEHEGRLYYQRFSVVQRVQHILLFSSFFALIATGMPLLFAGSPLVRHMFFFEGAYELRGLIHRVAAVVLLAASVFHVFYVLFSVRGNSDLRRMVVWIDDIRQAFAMLSFNLGRSGEPPRFDRFNFIEKFEYYAAAWGSAIMLATGACLWFPVQATLVFPRPVLDIIRVIHGFEAILAFLAVIIWHMYNVHLNPEVFPMSRVWMNGRMELEHLAEHHPLEFERMLRHIPADMAGRVRAQMGVHFPSGPTVSGAVTT